MSEETEIRSSVLGGEVASRYVGGYSPPAKIIAGVVFVASLAVGIFGPGLVGVALGVIMFCSTLVAIYTGYGARKIQEFRNRWRRRNGEHVFIAPSDPDYDNPDVDPGWNYPVPLGQIEPVDLAGTGLDDMFILFHHNPGEADYFSMVLSVQGLAEGLRSDEKWAQNMQTFSQLLSSSARRSSHIRGFGMVLRAVPSDMTPHKRWIQEQMASLPEDLLAKIGGPDGPIIQSYGDVVDQISPHAEDHRTFLVVMIGANDDLMKEAARIAKAKGASVEGGVAQVIRDEVGNVQRALSNGGYGRVDVLGEQRACAVVRSMINPSFPLDKHADVRWENCFPSYVGGQDSVGIRPTGEGEDTVAWHTRVATVPPSKVAPVELRSNWLAPLLTGVDPDAGDASEGIPPTPTIRTIAVRMDLVPAEKARSVTRKHRTSDRAKAIEDDRKGKVSDGTGDVMAVSADRRAIDLQEGSGYHGVIWSMTIAVTGRDEDDCHQACSRINTAADESAITELAWREHGDHDVAMFWTLPFGRGMASTRYTR